MLTLRKHEKDYMLRGDQKYLQRLDKMSVQLITNIRNSLIDDADKENAVDLVETYIAGVNQLSSADQKIASLREDMKADADPIMAFANQLNTTAEANQAEITTQIQASVGPSISLMWGVSIVSVLISMAFGIIITRNITKPLTQTVTMIGEMEQGILGKRLNMTRKDEIGCVAVAMDNLANSLQNEVMVPIQKLAADDLTFEVNLAANGKACASRSNI